MKLLILAFLVVTFMPLQSSAIDCPKMPEQTNKEWDVEVKAAVAKIGPVKGAELETRTRNATRDLMGKLPQADKVYLEQMMYATYCSALRDDKTLTESERARMIRAYNLEVRKTLFGPQGQKGNDKQGSPPKDERVTARVQLSQMSLAYTPDAFVESVRKGDIDAVKLFLAAGMDPNAKNKDQDTALKYAVSKGHRQIMNALLKAKANVNEKNHGDWTALAWATDRDKKDILLALLDHGANTESKNHAFLSAASDGNRDTLGLLIKRGADIRAVWDKRSIRDRALTNAVGRNHPVSLSEKDLNETAKFLLDLGADVNTRDYSGSTPLMLAIYADHLTIARALLDRGADVNRKSDCHCLHREWTALMFAAWYGRTDIVRPLLDKGADINAKCDQCDYIKNGSTALMIALTKSDRSEIAEILINRNADLNLKNDEGQNALLLAAEHSKRNTLLTLLGKGLDINQRDKGGNTALMHACWSCDIDKVQLLLDNGADVNTKNRHGETALMFAVKGRCEKSLTEIIRALLDKGHNINDKTDEGKTTLMMAASLGNIGLVKTLLERGADANEKDIYGKTALDFAEKSGLKEEKKEKMLWMLKKATDMKK